MAAPTIAAKTSASTVAASTTLVINKPTGVVNGSRLLILVDSLGNNSGNQFTEPTGFTRVFEHDGGALTNARIAAFQRKADGTEGSTFTITNANSEEMAAVCYRLDSASSDTDAVDNAGVQTTFTLAAAKDVPEITTGEDDTLVIAVLGFDGGDGGVWSVAGTGWSLEDSITTGGGSADATLSVAIKTQATAGLTADAEFSSTLALDSATGCMFSVKGGSATTREQEGYRWRNDDGSESLATWKQAQDVAHTGQSKLQTLRLRVLANYTSGPETEGLKLQFRKTGDADTEWEDLA